MTIRDLLITLARSGHDSRLKIVVDVGPNGIQHAGAVWRMREAGHYGVLFRDDDTELAPGTVQAVSAVGAAPHLIAVTLVPIVEKRLQGDRTAAAKFGISLCMLFRCFWRATQRANK